MEIIIKYKSIVTILESDKFYKTFTDLRLLIGGSANGIPAKPDITLLR